MFVPIDDDIDVPLKNIKNATLALELFITKVTDEEISEGIREGVRNHILSSPVAVKNPALAQSHIKHSFDQMDRAKAVLQHNNYTYLTADVCDMISDTYESLPPWSLKELPIKMNTSGIILFEKPKFITFVGTPGKSEPTYVSGLMWDYRKMTIYRGNIHKDNKQNTITAPIFWVSLVIDTPVNGLKADTMYTNNNHEFAYIVHDNNILEPLWQQKGTYDLIDENVVDYFAATMMLMQQREIIAEPETYEPTVKRGKRRDPVLVPTRENGEKIPFRISTVSLSETVRKAYAANNAGTGHKPTKSWWVKGHWRRQPYGPQSSLRKLIYIHPHISGNVSAPLDERKTITKVVP